ncbi:ATP-binding cassette subfamily C protein LapB [Pseudomonas sp. 3296]|uniref:ATP-binding cassette domain-containing protein n=1 Tax=Pseudomonas sp. 3296 TaxID=2817753 RepID=UPI00285F0CDA|nr:ATP-binding cassette domain-containing protein [Pseudomonas sp. 3296]MDR6919079.1 ATP-binding cassette subfamily C protein LapB [Pseudomonas sp. 3296]
MSESLSPNFTWLLTQLTRIEGVKPLPRAKARQLGARWDDEASVTDSRACVEALFTESGLQCLPWADRPSAESLPMLVIMPGLGLHLLHAGGPQQGWLLVGPTGRQRLRSFPDGVTFMPIRVCARSKDALTARALLRSIFFADRQWLVFATVATIVGNLLALGVSLYSMQVYDRVIPTHGISTLVVLTVAAGIAITLELLLKLARSAIVHASLSRIDESLSHGLFARFLRVRLDQLPPNVGVLSGQLRGYETLRGFVSMLALYLMADAPFALLFLVGIYWISGPQLASVVLVFLVVSLVVGLLFRRRIEAAAQAGMGSGNRKQGLLIEAVGGAEGIKSTGASWHFQSRWNNASRDAIEQDGTVRKLSEMASYLGASLQQAAYVVLVATGAYIAGDANITTGALVACSILSGRVLAPIGMLPGLLVQSGHAKAALKGLEDVFKLHQDNHAMASPLVPERIEGRFTLDDVTFAYGPEAPPIKLAKLVIASGEKVAILGTVGAGKSTLLRILAGLYQPHTGKVLLDDLDIQQIARERLCDDLGYLPQQVSLFAGSLRDNLLLGIPSVNDEALLSTAKATGLLDFVTRHPQGLDMRLADGGVGLSGGQRQLVALTRLVLAQPTLWLLDEPTASMDASTEARCLNVLVAAIRPTHTAVIVTHKPALLKLVDRIVVITPDGVAMDGPRDEILCQLEGRPKAAQATPPQPPAAPQLLLPIAFKRSVTS